MSKIHKIIDGRKVCPQCLHNLPISEYYKNKQSSSDIMSWCKNCCKRLRPQNTEYFKEYYQKNKDKRSISDRCRRYGLTKEQYSDLLARQDNKCRICKKDFKSSNDIHVDHDHRLTRNIVRGLLCNNCNHMLGNAKDDIDILFNAINYLELQYAV